MKFSILFSAFLLAFFACKNSDPNHQAQDKLRGEIFAVHDEVMPKMSELNRIQRELKKIGETARLDSAASARLTDVLLKLEKADEGMMQWMEEFQQPAKLRDSKPHEEIMEYLAAEKQKVDKVKAGMLGSIEEGKALLNTWK